RTHVDHTTPGMVRLHRLCANRCRDDLSTGSRARKDRSCSFYQFARPTTLLGPVTIPVLAPMPPGVLSVRVCHLRSRFTEGRRSRARYWSGVRRRPGTATTGAGLQAPPG